MRADILKTWLAEKGCRFDEHAHDRKEGHGSLTVKLGGKHSVLPLVGTHQDLKTEDVARILGELGLSADDLPGHHEPKDKEIYKNWRAGK